MFHVLPAMSKRTGTMSTPGAGPDSLLPVPVRDAIAELPMGKVGGSWLTVDVSPPGHLLGMHRFA